MKSKFSGRWESMTLILVFSGSYLFGSTLQPALAQEGDVSLEPSLIKEVVHETQLKYGEEYRSEFLDIREFQNVTFYAIPLVEVLNRPEETARYQMDAFFAVDTSLTTFTKFGETRQEVFRSGVQEFGAMHTNDQGVLIPSFEKLSTGETTSRALHSRVYGPYVRVLLTNLTPDERRKFKIIAFLTRGESTTG